MFMLVPLLCAVLLVVANAQIYFNSTFNCTEGCAITNPEIYIGNQLPTREQEVIFNSSSLVYLFAPSNTTFAVNKMSAWNATLVIYPNSTVEVVEELEFYHVYLHINKSGALACQDEAYFEASHIVAYGRANIGDAEFLQTKIVAYNGSDLYFDGLELENGTIDVFLGSLFSTYDESEFSFSNIYFETIPFLGEVDFESVNAYFPAGFYAEDQISISSSNFTAYFPDALAGVSIVLAGKNNLNISNLVFNSDKIIINSTGSTPYISFQVSNNASFDGNLTVPGEIVIASGSNVHFNGTISLSGGIIADVNSATQIKATGSLYCGNAISLVGHNENNSFTVNNAVLTAPSLKLEAFVLYSITGTTVINGSVINNGSIHIFESSCVIVQGNYTQLPNTTFGAYNVDNNNNRPINLIVNGSAVIDGDIKYNTSENDRFTVAVIKALHGLSGTFATSEFYGDESEYKPKVLYTPDSVQISINPDQVPSWQGLYWWVWVLIGAGALTVIIALIIIVRVVRQRAKYEPVQSYSGY